MSKDNNQNSKNDKSSKRPIIYIKKIKKAEEEHHGGTWKIAYADFVTAMMAFFMLMWLINTVSQEKLRGIAEFFTPVVGLRSEMGSGVQSGSDSVKNDSEKTKENETQKKDTSNIFKDKSFPNIPTKKSDVKTVASIMNNLEKNLTGAMERSILRENVNIESTPEGIKIQIMDSTTRSVYKSQTSEIQPYMVRFLKVIGNLVRTVPNHIAINGHTSEKADKDLQGFDQWRLSIERAESMHLALRNLLKQDQLLRITGKADKEPYDPTHLDNPKNSRIDIILMKPDTVEAYQKPDPSI